jgi:hypothetical protein
MFMTTRIDPTGPAPVLTTSPTAQRTTAPPTRPFQSVMYAGAGAVVSGAEAAVQRLPGGSVLAAALRATGPNAYVASGSVTAARTTPDGYPTTATGTGAPAPGSSTSTGGDPGIEGMLNQNADQNMYFIALQERISAENRTYSAYSNVLRVRHDTMKNAIGNLR